MEGENICLQLRIRFPDHGLGKAAEIDVQCSCGGSALPPVPAHPSCGAQQTLQTGLRLFGDYEVSQHVEGVAVWMHSHHFAVLLVNQKEPGIVEADYPHLWSFSTSQADLLSTV